MLELLLSSVPRFCQIAYIGRPQGSGPLKLWPGRLNPGGQRNLPFLCVWCGCECGCEWECECECECGCECGCAIGVVLAISSNITDSQFQLRIDVPPFGTGDDISSIPSTTKLIPLALLLPYSAHVWTCSTTCRSVKAIMFLWHHDSSCRSTDLGGVCLFMSVCMSVCLFVCQYVCLSASLSVWVSDCVSACLPACLSGCLIVCLSVCVSVWWSKRDNTWQHQQRQKQQQQQQHQQQRQRQQQCEQQQCKHQQCEHYQCEQQQQQTSNIIPTVASQQ